MKVLRALTLMCVLVAGGLPSAHAIGDSGGCGDPLGGSLGKALKSGDGQAIEAALNAWLDAMEKRLGIGKRLALQVGGAEAQATWRNQQAASVIEGKHEKGAICAPGPLLPVAINAGNVEGTRYLLDRPLGVKPRVPERVLFTCNDELPTDAQRLRRREAYAVVLDTRQVNIDARLGEHNRTAVETCYDVVLLSLFLERGAVIDTQSENRFGVLDRAVEDAVGFEENSYTARRLAGLERARFFAERLTRSIRGRDVEARAQRSCNMVIGGKRWNETTCRALSAFIVAAPGTFGSP